MLQERERQSTVEDDTARVEGSDPGDLPILERTVPKLLRRAVASVPDQLALIEPGVRTMTYAELGDASQRVGTALRGLGLEAGDRVLVMLDQHVDTAITWLGANIATVAFVGVNTAYKGEMLRYLLEHCGTDVLVIEGSYCDRLADVADELTHVRKVVVRGTENAPLDARFERIDFADLLATEPQDVGEPSVWDVSAILYTSGTEGRAKGVLMPHGHCYMSSYSYVRKHHETEVMIVTLPLFHGGGLNTSLLQAIRTAGTAVLHGTFSPGRFWDDVRRYSVTNALIVGPMAAFLMQQPPTPEDREHNMKSLIMFPAIPAVAEFSERFGIPVGVGYGQTEQGPSLLSPPGDGKPGLCGTPTAYFEARLVDGNDLDVPVGEAGELVLRPRDPWSMMSGYLDDATATATAWRNLWFHTGDMLRIDPSTGQWAFVDRRKDVLRRRGENISSMEVERQLVALAGVLEAAVVAAPSEHGEDEIKAVLVLAPGMDFDHLDALHTLYRQMPYFMVPRYIELVEALPKTQSLRVQKGELRAAGVNGDVWDCEAVGIRITRKGLVQV